MSDLKEFCQVNVDRIEGQFNDLDIETKKLERLVLQHGIYKTLINVIEGPQHEREALEKHLTSLLE